MNYPFLQKSGKGLFVRLNKELYPKELIERVIKEEPAGIQSFNSRRDHYLVEVKSASNEDYLSFLNYLVYLNRK